MTGTPYRHIIVVKDEERFPAKILVETEHMLNTDKGLFDKNTMKQWGHPAVTFVGPFTTKGERECRA